MRIAMNPNDLELISTSELVDELLRRTTFQGVIIHARDGAKTPGWQGERVFSVRYNTNLEAEEAGRLLEVVSEHIASLP